MKRTSFLLLALTFVLQTSTWPWSDKVITSDQLPRTARAVLKKHFPNPVLIKHDREVMYSTYDVVFANGNTVEFDSSGNWTKIDCQRERVPEALIPKAILATVRQRWPLAHIVQIERDRFGYDIELSNGLDIEFDKQFKIREVDD